MQFNRPLLLLLIPLTLLALRRTGRFRFPTPPEPEGHRRSLRVRVLWVLPLLTGVALLACIVAAAGPFRPGERVPDRRRARDIVLAVDLSESMRGLDLEVGGRRLSRLQAALRFAGRFIERREGDRIGVVAFGGRAITQCPLTFDRRVARELLGHLEPDVLGKRTAIGDGIALAVARLERGGALVLLTDGQNTAGRVEPGEAMRAARARGVRIYSVGIGSEGPVPVPARLPSGRVRLQMKDYPLDEALLRRTSAATDGRYFRARDAAALASVFREIDRLEEKPTDAFRVPQNARLARVAALTAACALGALLTLSSTFLRTAPALR